VRALLLSSAGYRVLTAANREDALRVFRLNPVDLVIIDLWRNQSCGMDVLGEMKRINPKVPVTLWSGLTNLPSGFEQADLHLTKCITPTEFLAAIRSVVPKAPGAGAEDE
jgi:DNA-binding response OmpR family regulator